jgi:Zn-dependent M28 family amino/carboxypeptidase
MTRFQRIHASIKLHLWIVVMPIAVGVLLSACRAEVSFDGKRAHELVRRQVEQGPRIPGSEAHRLTGTWIIQELESHGWEAAEQVFEYQQVLIRNIIGRPSSDIEPRIILGAHYDTRPISDSDPERPDLPTPGANDGGSGVAVLLELARVLDDRLPVWLVFFDAEDSGRVDGWEWNIGSDHFAESLSNQLPVVVVVDMVGNPDLRLCAASDSDMHLRDEIWDMANYLSQPAFRERCTLGILDDHTPFVRRGFSAIDIIDFDDPYWHTTEDTVDKVSAESLAQIGVTLENWIETRLGFSTPSG